MIADSKKLSVSPHYPLSPSQSLPITSFRTQVNWSYKEQDKTDILGSKIKLIQCECLDNYR